MTRIFFIMAFSLLILAISFQNCSDVELSPNEVVQNSFSQKPSGHLCPGQDPVDSEKLRVIFLIDMSISNLGEVCPEYVGGDSLPWKFNLKHVLPGDWNGNRFSSAKSFVEQFRNANNNISFSVIGFSDIAMFNNPLQNPRVRPQNIRDCFSGFTDSVDETLDHLDQLHAIQNDDKALDNTRQTHNRTSPFRMSTTSYKEALDCLDNTIKTDLANNSEAAALYQVFFLTDGKPLESENLSLEDYCEGFEGQQLQECETDYNNCNGDEDCLQASLNQGLYQLKVGTIKKRLELENLNLNFTPIFYQHPDVAVDPNDPELPTEEEFSQCSPEPHKILSSFDVAQPLLDELALSANPNASGTVLLENLGALTEELNKSLKSDIKSPYMVSNLSYINLNTIEKNGAYILDSDMDGLSNQQEIELGLDPFDSKSSGILDSICYREFNLLECDQKCPDNSTELFSDCEKNLVNSTELDTDNDSLLDIVEIIKNTNHLISDSNQQDFDGDKVSNMDEILRGTNPKLFTQHHLIKDFNELELYPYASNRTCENSDLAKSCQVKNSSFVDTIEGFTSAYQYHGMSMDYTKDENLFLIYYIARSLRDENKDKVFAKILRVKKNSDASIVLNQNLFQEIGELD